MIFMSIQTKKKNINSEHKSKVNENKNHKLIILIIGIILIIILSSSVYFYKFYNASSSSTSFTNFKNNFYSANQISISVNYNSTAFPYEISCATSLIYNIITTTHRNPDTINFFVLNNTACTYLKNGLGHLIKNYSYSNITTCLNIIKTQPTIFINYSQVNKTIIKSNAIYVLGNQNFLKECGIADQIK